MYSEVFISRNNMSKKPRGSIHKIREFELEKIQLVDEFDILQIVGEGWFGKILLVEHRASHTEMVLKAVPKPYVSLRDFYREFHYGLHLGIHRNIVTTYDVAFETAGFYVFTQEYAPLGDLTSNVTDTGVGEVYSKRVAKQIAAALDYMHSKDIVHRDVKLDNVLIYRSDFSRVKLCDFGESYQNGTLVERRNEWLPYSPPEVLDIKPEGTYKADSTHDVWQFAIVVFVCLTGCLPWQKAASDDPRYVRYVLWQSTMMLAMRRTPKLFKLLTSRAQRMFKRLLEPRYDRRPKNLADLTKYMDDRWLAKTAEKEMAEYETDELCPSMYSFHSSPDEKNRLLYNLADYGIETNVDRQTKKNRIKEWIESSVIAEEEEEDNDETNSASSPSSSTVSREAVRGHISSLRPPVADKSKEIKTTLKDASHKHFDPRTGALQQGPSEMGATALPLRSESGGGPFSAASNLSTMNNDNSLAGSILTMGSRADFFNSDMEIYNSAATDLHLLGEPNNILQQQQLYNYMPNNSQYMLTSNNDLFSNLEAVQHPTKNTIGVGTSTVGGGSGSRVQKSILQRSKSDSVKYALSASTPTLNSKSFLTISNAMPTQPLNTDSKTVTFSGLTNAWDGGLPHEGMPQPTNTNSINQSTQTSVVATSQQQLQHYFNNNTPYESLPVKDSAYSSFDHHSEMVPVPNGEVGKLPQRQQQQQHNDIPSTVRTQNSQQQQQQESSTYRNSGALMKSSMKDTAYDRINSNNIRKRR